MQTYKYLQHAGRTTQFHISITTIHKADFNPTTLHNTRQTSQHRVFRSQLPTNQTREI